METDTQASRAAVSARYCAALIALACGVEPLAAQQAAQRRVTGERLLERAAARYEATARTLDPMAGSPRSTDKNGSWSRTPINEWTSGFFPGTLWYLYAHTGAPRLREQAEKWTWPLREIPRGSFHHDLGFQFNTAFLNAYRFTGDARFRPPALNAARLLASRFNPKVGAIKSWDWRDPRRTFPVIVDNMMNLELLFWGAQQPEGDPHWQQIAIQHARTTIANHLRDDGGSFHVVVFDTATGRAQERVTHQGYADHSTWARGQSWLVYGFTMAYRETRLPEFLAAAGRTADYALAHLPPDGVPCWDYQAPGCPASARRDASAAAILASALLELSTYAPSAEAERYRRAAEKTLSTLGSAPYLAHGGQALLGHAVGNHPAGTEIDVGITYADYYFVEALLRDRELRGAAQHGIMPRLLPRTYTARPENLREARRRLERGDPALEPALRLLVQRADSAIRLGPFTVTAKERVPPSGDKRDYVSYGPYWWPDTTKPDGLPFIRRDGEVNQTMRRDSDVLRWYAFTDAVETLAHAYYFTGNAAYAQRAAVLLRAWFVEPATRMNPHLRYAQAIPGVVEGRGIGIIDTRDAGRLTDAIALLQDSPVLSDEDDRALRDWFQRYLSWLKTSEHGKAEADETNNHGTWYDVQIVALSLFLGDTLTAREVAEQARTKRIGAQVDSSGRQPLELARTRSLHYSVENMEGMTRLAEMARAVGVDLWNYEAPSGGSIRKAIAFVAPYASARDKWPFPQITKEAPDLFFTLLRRADAPVADSSALARAHRSRLLYPDAPRVCDLDCMLVSQLVVSGRRTGWPARSYISVPHTLATMRSLMSMDQPTARVKTAVHAAAAWLKEAALYPGPVWSTLYDVRTGAVAGEARVANEVKQVLADYAAWNARLPVTNTERESLHVVVDARFMGPEGSHVDGVATFRRIGSALEWAPRAGAEGTYVIRIRNGRYYEKLAVELPNVHLIGENRDSTLLTFDAAAASPAPSGGSYGTRGSSTLRIAAPGFRLENMTVENGFDYMSNYVKPNGDPTKWSGSQGVAVMLDYGSDQAVFENCAINGHQDTLFPNAGRSFFHGCTITGSVDFIFGAGAALFDDVDIVSRDRGSSSNNGYITAASTPASQPFGFVIVNSRLRRESPGMAANTVTLGRSWHPAGDPDAVGSVVFIDTWMDIHIGAKGWDSMNSTDATGVRVTHRPEDARFYEFGSQGPGVVASPTRRVMGESEVARVREWLRTTFQFSDYDHK